LAYLGDVLSKFYSVTDGFGPLAEDYVSYSGAFVDVPFVSTEQVLEDIHYQTEYNIDPQNAGSDKSILGAIVRMARAFQNTCLSANAPKLLFSTPRPWHMNNTGEVNFLGTTYNKELYKPTYRCIDHNSEEMGFPVILKV
jgi:hypothetical protein